MFMSGSIADLLVVRGAPGVGKSSAVSRVRRVGGVGAVVEVDSLRGMIAKVEWTDKAHHMLALEHARLVADSFLARGFRPVVVVDTLGCARLDAWLPTLSASYRIVTLFAEPAVLIARIASRPEGQFKDLPPCLILNAEMERRRYPNERKVDTTSLTPDDVASMLLAELGGGMP